MHELGIVFHVIKSVEKIGEENGLTNVASVTLELGEVSGAIPHELESCWNWAVKKTELLPEAALKIETIPAVTYCEGCGREVMLPRSKAEHNIKSVQRPQEKPFDSAGGFSPEKEGGK